MLIRTHPLHDRSGTFPAVCSDTQTCCVLPRRMRNKLLSALERSDSQPSCGRFRRSESSHCHRHWSSSGSLERSDRRHGSCRNSISDCQKRKISHRRSLTCDIHRRTLRRSHHWHALRYLAVRTHHRNRHRRRRRRRRRPRCHRCLQLHLVARSYQILGYRSVSCD